MPQFLFGAAPVAEPVRDVVCVRVFLLLALSNRMAAGTETSFLV